MAIRRPLVLVSGSSSELPPGDTVQGVVLTTSLTAGSGLSGGGALATDQRIDISLATNPSGLIFVGTKLGIDGSALASGNAALTIIASGVPKTAPGSVITTSISGLQVTTAKIADGAITSAKLDSSLANLLNPDLFIDLL